MLLLLLWGAACGGERKHPEQVEEAVSPMLNLSEEFAGARVLREPGLLEPGAPEGRVFLLEGWSRGEVDRQRERSFAWGTGPVSRLRFPVLARREMVLRLEGRPFRFPGAPVQEVELGLNGVSLGRLPLSSELSQLAVTLPDTALEVGENELELRYAYHRSPREVGVGGDRRSLAVAWYAIQLGGEEPTPEPQADTERSLLFLPAGSRLDYFFEIPPAGRLEMRRLVARGGSRLEVSVGRASGEEASLREGVETWEGPLPLGEAGSIVRLSLTALPAPEIGAGMALFSPIVEGSKAEGSVAGGRWISGPREAGISSASQTVTASARPVSDAEAPNILVYMIDTLRADHLGCYGGEGGLTPRIDAFAKEAVLFERAFAQASWTKASVASVLTGLGPLGHGTNGRDDRLSEAATTLAEILSDAGYESGAIVTNPNVTEAFGFAQGFSTFLDLGEETESNEVGDQALAWLDAREQERPFFLYLHTLDPHTPYDPPAAMRRLHAPEAAPMTARASKQLLDDLQAGRRPLTERDKSTLERLYAAEVAANDQSFGELLAGLGKRGLAENTVVLLLSDHGEEFLEHGNWEHGKALHVESLHVPLLLRLPGVAGGRRVRADVDHLDVLPTLLSAVGLQVPPTLPGRNLLNWLDEGSTTETEREILSFLHLDGPARISLRRGDWALIQQLEEGRLIWPRLYARGEDPGEERNLWEGEPIVGGYLESRLRGHLEARSTGLQPEKAVLDPELERSLRALGYLQ